MTYSILVFVVCKVENKAKARKQAEHRAQQKANNEKQRLEKQRNKQEKNEKRKKSRGAIQREKRRQKGVSNETGDTLESLKVAEESKRGHSSAEQSQKVKLVKPSKKKHKVDKEERDFDTLVDAYRAAFSSAPKVDYDDSLKNKRPEESKRWFE